VFVEEQQLRAPAHRHGELHLALLAVGELSIVAARQRRQVSHLHHHFRPRRIGVVTGHQVNLLADAQVRRRAHLLHHHANAAARLDL